MIVTVILASIGCLYAFQVTKETGFDFGLGIETIRQHIIPLLKENNRPWAQDLQAAAMSILPLCFVVLIINIGILADFLGEKTATNLYRSTTGLLGYVLLLLACAVSISGFCHFTARTSLFAFLVLISFFFFWAFASKRKWLNK